MFIALHCEYIYIYIFAPVHRYALSDCLATAYDFTLTAKHLPTINSSMDRIVATAPLSNEVCSLTELSCQTVLAYVTSNHFYS